MIHSRACQLGPIRSYARYARQDARWAVSEALRDRKSVFVGRALTVHSEQEAKQAIAELKLEKQISKASHNITAWRIANERGDVVYEAHDNNGEPPAGEHTLTFLRTLGLANILVVVTRWYGGVPLGSDRFRHVHTCAHGALVAGDYIKQDKSRK